MQGPEQRETNRIRKDLELYDPNVFTHKESTSGYTGGIPDLFVCTRGQAWWFEVKVYPNKPTVLQQTTMNDISRAGGNVGLLIVRDVDKGRRWEMGVIIYEHGNISADGIAESQEVRALTLERSRGEHWDFGQIFEGKP